MAEFTATAIVVDLQKPPHKILMIVREAYEGSFVVFADPAKLGPHVDALLAEHPEPYNRAKRAEAMEGFAEAAINAETCTIPGPAENPLPLALVNLSSAATAALAFTDGLTRTALLIELGAHFAPLQAASADEARELHGLVGTSRMPEPVAGFIVTESRRNDLALAYRPGC